MAASASTSLASSWDRLASSWACTDDVTINAVLNQSPCCLLVASCISQADPHLPYLMADLRELLTTFRWARALINFFGATSGKDEQMKIARVATSTHGHIASTFIPGFKTLFWARALTPKLLGAFTHLFLFDSDMVVRPSQFDLVGLLRIQEAVNASIIAPSPYGENPGTYHLGMARCPDSSACKCSLEPHTQCVACRQPMVEVKVPLFTRDAWRAVYEHLLAKVPHEVLTADKQIDLVCSHCSRVRSQCTRAPPRVPRSHSRVRAPAEPAGPHTLTRRCVRSGVVWAA